MLFLMCFGLVGGCFRVCSCVLVVFQDAFVFFVRVLSALVRFHGVVLSWSGGFHWFNSGIVVLFNVVVFRIGLCWEHENITHPWKPRNPLAITMKPHETTSTTHRNTTQKKDNQPPQKNPTPHCSFHQFTIAFKGRKQTQLPPASHRPTGRPLLFAFSPKWLRAARSLSRSRPSKLLKTLRGGEVEETSTDGERGSYVSSERFQLLQKTPVLLVHAGAPNIGLKSRLGSNVDGFLRCLAFEPPKNMCFSCGGFTTSLHHLSHPSLPKWAQNGLSRLQSSLMSSFPSPLTSKRAKTSSG